MRQFRPSFRADWLRRPSRSAFPTAWWETPLWAAYSRADRSAPSFPAWVATAGWLPPLVATREGLAVQVPPTKAIRRMAHELGRSGPSSTRRSRPSAAGVATPIPAQ
jgi:hypothetical protein